MRRLAPGDRVYITGDLTRVATVHAGPTEPLATVPPVALDSVLVSYEGEPPVEVWRRQCSVVSRAPNAAEPCGFCGGKPVQNAATWTQRDAPATVACPRCGE